MSDQSDIPQYKMVNGELVELTQDEIDEIMRERAGVDITDPVPPEEPVPETRTSKHGHRRTK